MLKRLESYFTIIMTRSFKLGKTYSMIPVYQALVPVSYIIIRSAK
ncbi:MAG TPA: hypothetical protein VK484_04595 [Ferruginibacter sp.]|nr:hypothetical protein [Ferruginibacter sp.]